MEKKATVKTATVITATGKNGNRKKSTSVKTATKFDSSDTTCTVLTVHLLMFCVILDIVAYIELFPNIKYSSHCHCVASMYFLWGRVGCRRHNQSRELTLRRSDWLPGKVVTRAYLRRRSSRLSYRSIKLRSGPPSDPFSTRILQYT